MIKCRTQAFHKLLLSKNLPFYKVAKCLKNLPLKQLKMKGKQNHKRLLNTELASEIPLKDALFFVTLLNSHYFT